MSDATPSYLCSYCEIRPVGSRGKTCSDTDCRRLHRNAKQAAFQRAHKVRTGEYYSNQYRRANPPPPSSVRRVAARCRACGAINDRLKRHLPKDGLTVCDQRCQRYMKTGRWPTSPVPASHPTRSTSVPDDHPCREKPVWVLKGPRFIGRTCRWCGEQFLWDRLPVNGAGFEVWHCSPRCSTRAGRAAQRLRYGRFAVSDVVRQEIYRRDGWRCRLCGGRVAKSKQTPHPKAATLDHIVPRSRDGSDDPANLQLAHFMCNVMKSDGVSTSSGDQLALLG